jgi:hypothetical protein
MCPLYPAEEKENKSMHHYDMASSENNWHGQEQISKFISHFKHNQPLRFLSDFKCHHSAMFNVPHLLKCTLTPTIKMLSVKNTLLLYSHTHNSPSHSSKRYIKYTHEVKVEENTALQESSTLQVGYPSWPNIGIKILLLDYVTCRNGNIKHSQARTHRLVQICPPGKCKTQSTPYKK